MNKYFGDKKFNFKVLMIALPIMLQNLVTTSVNLVDSLMVGQLGDAAIGGVAAVNRFYMIMSFGVTGFVSAVGIFVVQANKRLYILCFDLQPVQNVQRADAATCGKVKAVYREIKCVCSRHICAYCNGENVIFQACSISVVINWILCAEIENAFFRQIQSIYSIAAMGTADGL